VITFTMALNIAFPFLKGNEYCGYLTGEAWTHSAVDFFQACSSVWICLHWKWYCPKEIPAWVQGKNTIAAASAAQ